MWTFGRKIAAGFMLAFLLLLGIGAVAYRSTGRLAQTSYWVEHTHEVLEHVAEMVSLLKDAETGQRGYVITGDEAFLGPYQSALGGIAKVVKELRTLTVDNQNQQKRIDDVEPLIAAKMEELKRTIDLRRKGDTSQVTKIVSGGEGKRTMDSIRRLAEQMDNEERGLLKKRAEEVESASSGTKSTIIFGTLVCLLFVMGAGVSITRSLSGQIGQAVRHVQSSSVELQATANQQASGAKESSTAMNEISTTISELLASSRQIAESAQQVAHIAEESSKAARTGEQTVEKAHESVSGIKRQVDLIVTHMLDLGKKSQQIGGILEIINELAEQTNILAINATIEAAGAGDAGKRFAVVADEIRKLADRVSGSTKEIRQLIEEIRAAVNTTVMATEGGTKAVDLGARQFAEVTTALKQITSLSESTMEAAREIELSTKQQATAVEQVNSAIGNVSTATKETETSLTQTLQTATQLTGLSRELTRLIQPNMSA
ncbi:MAG TPA: CHASE3 domain-containing protein [Candidatus Saccharimonadales bacterium]|jgi:methyl-accepting chemotaxis protein|nr:CHASE3 domain-containing protein [Candidatus Saccharimonadales bacterium]